MPSAGRANGRRVLRATKGPGFSVRAGQELTHFKLLPGEEVRSPLVALVFWQGDWIDGQNVWRRWMIAHNLPRPGGQLPAPLLSSGTNGFTIEMQGANEQNEKEFMQQYFDLRMEVRLLVDGRGLVSLQRGLVEHRHVGPRPRALPARLPPHLRLRPRARRKTIVWFEPERVTAGSWLWENHPEWLLGQRREATSCCISATPRPASG